MKTFKNENATAPIATKIPTIAPANPNTNPKAPKIAAKTIDKITINVTNAKVIIIASLCFVQYLLLHYSIIIPYSQQALGDNSKDFIKNLPPFCSNLSSDLISSSKIISLELILHTAGSNAHSSSFSIT